MKDCDVRTYSYPNQPIEFYEKWGDHTQVHVCAIIDADNGPLVLHVMERTEEHKGFKKEDMVVALQKLRDVLPEGPIGLFWDNASIHKAGDTMAEARRLQIEPFFNVPYRPQWMGVEHLWKHMKEQYRAHITNLRARKIEFSNLDVVQTLCDNLDREQVKSIAVAGWLSLLEAEVPVQNENLNRGFELHSEAGSTFNMEDPQEQDESSSNDNDQI